MIYQNILQAIGNTPIVKMNQVGRDLQVHLYGKIEAMNPGGSIKDRIGGWLIDDAVKNGRLKAGGTIVESTSGNTGVGIAIAAAVKGFKCVFVLPDKMSSEKINTLRAYGAEVIVTPTDVAPDDPRSYYSTGRRIAAERPNAVYIDQYNNLANRECHYQTTGPEILKQFPELDIFVAGIGTGGTLCGIGRYLKENKPSVKIVGVDPVGSLVYHYFKTGNIDHDHVKPYKVEGIGEDFIPKNYDFKYVDDMVQAGDKDSFSMARELLTKEGLFSGVSCGAAMTGAIQWLRAQGDAVKGKNVLVILPDSGNRYLSKLFNDEWMKKNELL